MRRILLVKAKMKLADHPFSDPALTAAVGSAEHRQVARECVRKSLVLLKNEKHALPLSKQIKRLVVAGPAANDLGIQCGGWTIAWQGKTGAVTRGGTTILAALRQAVGPDTEVVHSPDGSVAGAPTRSCRRHRRASLRRDEGRQQGPDLPAEDLAVLKQARESGVPVVTVVFSGRPVMLGPVLESSDAVIAAWLPGTEGRASPTSSSATSSRPASSPTPGRDRSTRCRATGETMRRANRCFRYGYGLTY